MNLSNAHNQRISVWKNNIPDIKSHNKNWIRDNHEVIYNYIKNNYANKNTIKSHLSTLAQIMKMAKNDQFYKKYSDESTDLSKSVQDSYLDQTVPINRNYISLEEIEHRRDELKDMFNADPSNNKLNEQYLILCLYTYQPPIRMEYKNMQIVDTIPNNTDNFMLHNNNHYYVIIQNDKVIRHYGTAQFELNDTLNTIINDSLTAYPRKYILSLISNPNKPIGKQGFEKLMNSCFPDKKVSVDLIRSAYITNRYNDKTFTMRQKKSWQHLCAILLMSHLKCTIKLLTHQYMMNRMLSISC